MFNRDNPRNPIVIIDDDPDILKSSELLLRSVGFNNFHTSTEPMSLIPYLENHQAEMVLLDLAMPGISGEELLPRLRGLFPEIPVVILTSTDDAETAARCLQQGASDYLVKPFEKEKLASLISVLNELNEYRRENDELRKQLFEEPATRPKAFAEIITRNKIMISLCNYLNSSAQSTMPILISGETGVGKELFARAVHVASGRSGPFLAINLAGLDDVAFSDALFGHQKGAFTGADQARPGLIKSAQGGTLFLDEIGDLSLQSQVKLLRVLQENEFFPLGSDLPQRAEANIVLATNSDLIKAEHEGSFRRDLYFRISAHRVTIPPLRERREDIPLLLDHFVRLGAQKLGRRPPVVPQELLEKLLKHSFPGNVRELESMVHEAMFVNSAGTLDSHSFTKRIDEARTLSRAAQPSEDQVRQDPSETLSVAGPVFPTIRATEEWLIAKAMERTGNNQSLAAALLGISRQTLSGKLKKTRDPS